MSRVVKHGPRYLIAWERAGTWVARRYGHGDGATSERWVYAVGMPPYVCTFERGNHRREEDK